MSEIGLPRIPLWQDGGMAAWIWLSIGVVLSIAEVIGGEFVLLMLGAGALVTAGVALVTSELWIQLIVFAISSVAFVVLGRPALLKKFHVKDQITRTNVEAIVGSKAMVISTVDAHGGQVKIGGEIWSAAGVEGHHPLPPGTPVTVVEVRGATAVVVWG
jgi:membrane protein implicated in regulation of membrane protease activity